MAGLLIPNRLHAWARAKIEANASITTTDQEKAEFNALVKRKMDEYALQHSVYYKLKDGTYPLPANTTVLDVIDKTSDESTAFMDKCMQNEFMLAAQDDTDLD